MSKNDTIEERINKLMTCFGKEDDGTSPTANQWRNVLERDGDKPITLVNLFKINNQDEFDKYAKVSIPKVASVGGKFLLVAPFEGMFLGSDENWDLVAIGSYPNTNSLLALFEDDEYQASYAHRIAACAEHKVYICNG